MENPIKIHALSCTHHIFNLCFPFITRHFIVCSHFALIKMLSWMELQVVLPPTTRRLVLFIEVRTFYAKSH